MVLLLLGCHAEVAPLTREELMDPASCASCHPVQYEQWSRSMHAYADQDPVFRALNTLGQRQTDGGLGTFCLGCHAPMAVREGATEDGSDLDELEPGLRAITCFFCHTTGEVIDDHNAGIWPASDLVLRAAIADPVTTDAHVSGQGDLQDQSARASAAMCGACHDVVTGTGLALERTYAEWLTTDYAGDELRTCGGCHMDASRGRAADDPDLPLRSVHDHSFPAVDVALIDFPGRAELAAAVQDTLDSVLRSDLTVCEGADGVEIRLGLENVGAGHGWPSGAGQDRRAWVELTATAAGEELLHVGDLADDQPVFEVEDPELWTFGDQLFDADGAPVHLPWEGYTYASSQLQGRTPGADTRVSRTWVLEGVPDTVEVEVHLRPFDVDLLRLLVDSGDLDPTVAAGVPEWTLDGATARWTGTVAACAD